jgi:UDP-N-acetylmuramyl pentapeptide synthase
LWVSTSLTHSMNFEKLGSFSSVAEAIAYEFGYFLEYCSKLVAIDGDESLQVQQLPRTKAEVKKITKKNYFEKYAIDKDGTKFTIQKETYSFSAMLPEEAFHAIQMCKEAVNYFQLPFDATFAKFTIPPGRGSLFAGVNDITIIDSCYNANLASMSVMLEMYKKFPTKEKWAVIGDMLEQGTLEKEEHEKLAELLYRQNLQRIIFLGPRVKKYTFPKLQSMGYASLMDVFLSPRDVLDFILSHNNGGETILFKGARFMEGIIENLLKDKKNVAKLARREKIWEIRRKQWGL